MIIKYEMRGRTPHNQPTEWVEFCGEFASWDAFDRFKAHESAFKFRDVRNAREVEKQLWRRTRK